MFNFLSLFIFWENKTVLKNKNRTCYTYYLYFAIMNPFSNPSTPFSFTFLACKCSLYPMIYMQRMVCRAEECSKNWKLSMVNYSTEVWSLNIKSIFLHWFFLKISYCRPPFGAFHAAARFGHVEEPCSITCLLLRGQCRIACCFWSANGRLTGGMRICRPLYWGASSVISKVVVQSSGGQRLSR